MFEKTRAALASAILGKTTGTYDANWFLRFLRLADEEDTGGVVRVSDAMKQNAWVNLAINAIARNISRSPFCIYQGEDEVRSGLIYELFASPNSYMSGAQLWEATVGWRKVKGEAFWIFESEYQGGSTPMRMPFPKEIWVVDPAYMKHVLNPEGTRITMWMYSRGTKTIPLMPNEVVHFKTWNKWDPFRGVNPLIAADEELSQDLQATRSNTMMLQAGSTPAGVLSSKQRLTEIQAKEIQERWEKAHKGASRAHRIAVLGADTTYQQVGLNPADLEYFNMRKWNRSTVLAVYGVPPAVVGVKDELSALSGADTKEQLRHFWNTILLPEQEALEDILHTQFWMRFNLSDYDGEFDNDDIQEVKDDEKARSEIDRAEIAAGLRLINEVRKDRGVEPVAWGDDWLVNAMLVPASSLVTVGPPAPVGSASATVDVLSGEIMERAVLEFTAHAPLRIARRTIWPDNFRRLHWEKLVRRWSLVEGKFKREIQTWFYEQRSALLARFAQATTRTVKADSETLLAGMDDPSFWGQEEGKLRKFALADFTEAMDMEGSELDVLFHDMGVLPTGTAFNIWDTAAQSHLVDRVSKGKLADITTTVRKHIRDTLRQGMSEGWTETQMADGIRDVYNAARGRAETIARTELGGIIGDSRFESFKAEGFEAQSWLSAGDELVRDQHQIDGEVVRIGEPFSNGLLYPNDPNGEAGNVINCRCVTLPEPLKELAIIPVETKQILPSTPMGVTPSAQGGEKELVPVLSTMIAQMGGAIGQSIAERFSAETRTIRDEQRKGMAEIAERISRPRRRTIHPTMRSEDGTLLEAEVIEKEIDDGA